MCVCVCVCVWDESRDFQTKEPDPVSDVIHDQTRVFAISGSGTPEHSSSTPSSQSFQSSQSRDGDIAIYLPISIVDPSLSLSL